jgi:hypothetical protein
MSDPANENDIDALLDLLAAQSRFGFHTALTALVAERNALRSELEGERQRFVKHLEDASRVVQTWPTWKQEVLGGTAVQPPAASDLRERNETMTEWMDRVTVMLCHSMTHSHDAKMKLTACCDNAIAAMRKGEADGK